MEANAIEVAVVSHEGTSYLTVRRMLGGGVVRTEADAVEAVHQKFPHLRKMRVESRGAFFVRGGAHVMDVM